jgi:hypothetical protein
LTFTGENQPLELAVTKKSKQQAKPGHVQRSATVAVRTRKLNCAQGCIKKTKRRSSSP